MRHAEVITKDEENQLWDSEVIGIDGRFKMLFRKEFLPTRW